jgi:hypothetical protein
MGTKAAVVAMITALAVPPTLTASQAITVQDELRAVVSGLVPETRIRVSLVDGNRIDGRFIELAGDTLRMQPQVRRPGPVSEIPLTEIAGVEVRKPGMRPWVKAVIVGSAIAGGIGLYYLWALMHSV